MWYWLKRKMIIWGTTKIWCWLTEHKWYDLNDPNDEYVNKSFCTRCLTFSKERKQLPKG